MAGLAGCTGILSDGKGVPGKAEPIEEPENGDGGGGVPSEVDSALNEQGANGYEGELTDMTGQSEVVIEVGAGDGLAFTGPAVQIDPGTTVVFEWTGQGGAHNVIHDAEEPAFDSREAHEGSSIGESGFQYEVTIEEEGNYVYFCDPHKSLGMWGALVVGGSSGGGGVPSAVDSYLSENSANGYDGSVTDMTGQSEVTIEVGAGEGLAFGPAAVRVDPGTTVVWEWTGNGGGHNVAVNEGPTTFSSETVSEAGHTFSQTLDEEGNYLYQCDPHSGLGMHGAVIVGGGGGGGGGGVPSAVDSYLSENSANGYDGSATDMTGQSSVTISVGAGEGLAFDPAAVIVDAGTEITWEWTGNGGGHNVAVNEGPTTFSSETVSEGGHTFSQEVEAGNYRYQCDPHSGLGMHGAVIVRE